MYRITRAIQVGSQLLSTSVISDHEVEEERSELEKGSFNSNNIFNSLIGFSVGVSCYDTETGTRCGHCPRGYVGDGRHCKPGQTCDDKPCFR